MLEALLQDNQLAMSMLDASPDAVLLVDIDGTVRHVNQRACELFQDHRDGLVGSPVEQLMAGDVRARHVEHRQRYIQQPIRRPMGTGLDLHGLRRDGTLFPAEISIGPISHAGQTWIVCTVRDITEQRAIETKLRASEGLLLEAQRLARIGTWHWDLASEQIHWSEEVFRMFGLPPTDRPLAYADIRESIHPDDRALVDRAIDDARNAGTSFSIEYRIEHDGISNRYVHANGRLGTDDRGRPVSVFGTIQDITERKRSEQHALQLAVTQAARDEAERMRERFEFLAEVSSALSSSLDINETLQALTDLIIPRLADWTTINVLGEDDRIQRPAIKHRDPEGQQILEAIRDRGYIPDLTSDHPLAIAVRSGEPQLHRHVTRDMTIGMSRDPDHLELSLALDARSVILAPLVARGRGYGVLTLGMSISGRIYDENDFALAREVAQRASVAIDNARLYRESQQSAAIRHELVSLVSHELKTPLTVIKGHTQILGRHLAGAQWDRQKIIKIRERLAVQIERLELLISDILDVSRVQQGRLELQVEGAVDLSELAGNVLAQFEDLTELTDRHRLILEAPTPVIAAVDPLRVDQLLANLISNAIKYSPGGGEVRVRVQRRDGDAVIKVEDEGVGISPEDQRDLFLPFHRGQAARRGISGTGLGLYIARQITEQHGGDIAVDSEPGRGTRFIVTLPVAPRPVE